MKKISYIASFVVLSLIALFTSCDRDGRGELDLNHNLAILRFEVGEYAATISGDTIRLNLPLGTDLRALAPVITLAEDAEVTPCSGEVVDFSHLPVCYRVTAGNLYQNYYVRITAGTDPTPHEHGTRIGYINWEDTEQTAGQERAWNWLQETYPGEADLLSLWDIQHHSVDMDQYAVIWYYTRGVEGNGTLPFRAYDSDLVTQMKAYAQGGGHLLLTGFAPRWLETLSIAPVPNNFYGHESGAVCQTNAGFQVVDHEIFKGLELHDGEFYLMSAGCHFENNTSAWYLASWGGYNNSVSDWQTMTGGKALATDRVDGGTANRVVMAEFAPTDMQHCHVVTINTGLYDWGSAATNLYQSDLERLTRNSLDYLRY